MSLRQVLTIFKTERELNDDETALLNTMRKWTDAERALFIESLSDKPQKKSSKKAAGGGGGGRSKRGAALGEKIRDNLQQRQPTVGGFADDADMVCAYQYPNDSAVNAGLRCGEGSINGVHDKAMGYAGYHEFVAPPATSAAGSGG